MIHGGLEWPLPKGLHPGAPLTLPARALNLAWTRADLTLPQILKKGEAIAAYRTQMEVLGRFMVAFEQKNELLSTTALSPAPLGDGVVPPVAEGQ